MPLAQTSITSAYANGAQATYTLRFDTDIFLLYYLCLIRVNPVHLWLVFRRGRLRLIIDCMRKNGGKEQNGLRKYSVCAVAQAAKVHNYKHKPRIADESAVSLSRSCDWKPFFSPIKSQEENISFRLTFYALPQWNEEGQLIKSLQRKLCKDKN